MQATTNKEKNKNKNKMDYEAKVKNLGAKIGPETMVG
jgi:hypothetical protein